MLEFGSALYVKKASPNYYASARFDDWLEVSTRLALNQAFGGARIGQGVL